MVKNNEAIIFTLASNVCKGKDMTRISNEAVPSQGRTAESTDQPQAVLHTIHICNAASYNRGG